MGPINEVPLGLDVFFGWGSNQRHAIVKFTGNWIWNVPICTQQKKNDRMKSTVQTSIFWGVPVPCKFFRECMYSCTPKFSPLFVTLFFSRWSATIFLRIFHRPRAGWSGATRQDHWWLRSEVFLMACTYRSLRMSSCFALSVIYFCMFVDPWAKKCTCTKLIWASQLHLMCIHLKLLKFLVAIPHMRKPFSDLNKVCFFQRRFQGPFYCRS